MSEGDTKGFSYGSIAVVILGSLAAALQVLLLVGMVQTLAQSG